MHAVTVYSTLTDEELISRCAVAPAPTQMEAELALRLVRALDRIDELKDTVEKLNYELEFTNDDLK